MDAIQLKRQTRTVLQGLFGLLLVGWPLLDTEPMGAVTPLRIGLGSGLLLLITGAWVVGGREVTSDRMGNTTDRVILVGLVWYVGHVIFGEEGGGPVDPYNLLISYVFGAAYLFCRQVGTGLVLPAMVLSGLLQAGVATAQLGGLTATRNMYYDLTGSFPNPGPLGGWLCVALLAAVLLTGRLYRNRRLAGAFACALGGGGIGSILLLTDSRAAWVGLGAGVVAMLLNRSFRYQKMLLGGVAVLLAAGLWALYSYKKESADGRLLVWRVSADLVAQKPLWGHGVGSFPVRYMPAQAAYFERHPDSRFVTVADQVSHPFNEWIGTACELGLIGVLVAFGVVATALGQREDAGKKVLLVGLVVFGLFSYPSAFLSFGLLGAALLAGEPRQSECRLAVRPTICRRAVGGGMIGVGGALLFHIAAAGQTQQSRYVLIQEASELMRRSDPAALPRLEELAGVLPIAEFYVDLGDLWLVADDPAQAARYYRQASRMIPSRLRPYEGLFRVHRATGQIDSATRQARLLLTMPVKVSNTTTIRIRRAAQEWLREQEGYSLGPAELPVN